MSLLPSTLDSLSDDELARYMDVATLKVDDAMPCSVRVQFALWQQGDTQLEQLYTRYLLII